MNSAKIKRRYLDLRLGNQTLSPILQFSNFMMLAYLTINELIPIWLFAPLFVLAVLTVYTYVGAKFRKHQQPIDMNMNYVKATENGKTMYAIMVAQKNIMDHLNIPCPDDFVNRIQHMKDIGDGKV